MTREAGVLLGAAEPLRELSLADDVRQRLVGCLSARLRFDDFSLVTRSETVAAAVCTVPAMWQAVERLLDRARIGRRPVRLLGVGAAGLLPGDEPRQVSLTGAGKDAAAEAADQRLAAGDSPALTGIPIAHR